MHDSNTNDLHDRSLRGVPTSDGGGDCPRIDTRKAVLQIRDSPDSASCPILQPGLFDGANVPRSGRLRGVTRLCGMRQPSHESSVAELRLYTRVSFRACRCIMLAVFRTHARRDFSETRYLPGLVHAEFSQVSGIWPLGLMCSFGSSLERTVRHSAPVYVAVPLCDYRSAFVGVVRATSRCTTHACLCPGRLAE